MEHYLNEIMEMLILEKTAEDASNTSIVNVPNLFHKMYGDVYVLLSLIVETVQQVVFSNRITYCY